MTPATAARNVLLASLRPPSVRVSDFGLAVASHRPGPEIRAGSAEAASRGAVGACEEFPGRWAPLEALEGGVWSEASDVWAWGVLLWEVSDV